MLPDYEYADLTDEEILQEEARKAKLKRIEREQETARMRKATNFRFKAGML